MDAVSEPRLVELAQLLKSLRGLHGVVESAASGAEPFHAYVLAGRRSDGVPGFVAREFWIEGDRIAHKTVEVFDFASGQNFGLYLTRGGLVDRTVRKGATWLDGPVSGVEKILAELEELCPYVGGAAQMVVIDNSEARWIQHPPVPEATRRADILATATIASGVSYIGTIYTGQLAAGGALIQDAMIQNLACSKLNGGTIAAAITMTSPSLQITSGIVTVLIDGTNYVLVRNTNGYYSSLAAGVIYAGSNGTGDLGMLTPTQVLIGGYQVVGKRQSGPGNAASWVDPVAQTWANNLLTALRTHGLVW